MEVRILVSLSHGNHPKPSMTRVGRCVLVRRKNSGWRHMNVSPKKATTKMCPHPEHWDFEVSRNSETNAMTSVSHRPSSESKQFAEKIGKELDRIIAEAPTPHISPIIGTVEV